MSWLFNQSLTDLGTEQTVATRSSVAPSGPVRTSGAPSAESPDEHYDGLVLAPPVPMLDLHEYGGPRHLALVEAIKKAIVAYLARTVGRNEPCPCESGRKFKKCHGAAA